MEEENLPVPGVEKLQSLSRGVSVFVGNGHSFGTDTILLAWFSMPKKKEICADFGTGCGTIPLLWCMRGKPSSIYAVEVQPAACDMARRSVRLNCMDGRIHVVQGDIRYLRQEKALPFGLDLIACNPPYTPAGAGVQSQEASARIARHETACTLSDVADSAAAFLRWGGRFCCCMHPARLCDTISVLRGTGLEPKRLRFVQQRASSTPFLFLLQAVRGGKPGVTVEPILLVEDENGNLSEEMDAAYGGWKGEKK